MRKRSAEEKQKQLERFLMNVAEAADAALWEYWRENNTPATPTLTQAGASTTFISSSQRAGTIISFKTALNRPGAYPATVTAWQTAGGQGKLHFPYAALRQLPLCELAGSEHLAMQAIHFPQV